MNTPTTNFVQSISVIESGTVCSMDADLDEAPGPEVRTRSLAEVLAPLDALAANSPNLIVSHGARFEVDGEVYELPRYAFFGPQAGDDPIRVGIFAGIHGDEPEGVRALVRFVQQLEASPELVKGYCLFIYPVINPTGFEDNTRHSRSGKDLNREFWKHSPEPEVQLLERELKALNLHGIISLHTDDTSHGFYGFVSGATLTEHLIGPAMQEAQRFLHLNTLEIIDGFNARDGVIREGYTGVLTAPPSAHPRPFEIILESPQAAPEDLKEQAFVAALESILVNYRQFIAYAQNL